jgi:hypothetical protein
MLYFNVTGKRHRILCKEVVSWFMGKFLPRHHIEISVVHRGLKREGVYGWCTVEDCDYRPRSFLIEIHNGLSFDDYLTTILHELWHVYQFVKGDLKDRKSKRYWKNSEISDVGYEDDPSEKEAHEMESILTFQYKLDKGVQM